MKKHITSIVTFTFAIASLLVILPAVNAQKNPDSAVRVRNCSNNPVREVIFTFEPEEKIVEVFTYNFATNNRANELKWIMLTENANKIPDSLCLIVDGERILNMSWFFMFDCNCDKPNLMRCLYTKGDNEFCLWNGHTYGPYSRVLWPEINHSDLSTVAFFYEKMDMMFYKDFDGTVTRVKECADSSLVRHSPNGEHTLKFVDNYCDIILDGEKYHLSDEPAISISTRYTTIEINNNGSVYLEVESGTYAINNLGVTDLLPGQRVDPSTGNIIDVEDFKEYCVIDWIDECEGAFNALEVYNKINSDGNNLYDKSGKHELLCHPSYSYVLIDDVKYGESAPIHVFYDADADAFVWIAVEDSELVRYTYRIN